MNCSVAAATAADLFTVQWRRLLRKRKKRGKFIRYSQLQTRFYFVVVVEMMMWWCGNVIWSGFWLGVLLLRVLLLLLLLLGGLVMLMMMMMIAIAIGDIARLCVWENLNFVFLFPPLFFAAIGFEQFFVSQFWCHLSFFLKQLGEIWRKLRRMGAKSFFIYFFQKEGEKTVTVRCSVQCRELNKKGSAYQVLLPSK